jgi:hypothetical protein
MDLMTTLLHELPSEFVDDGSRHLLPIARISLGVADWMYRWAPDALPGEGIAVGSWTAEKAPATRDKMTQATPAKQPIVAVNGGVKVLSFDGVDDEIGSSFGGPSNADNPRSITLMLCLDALPAAGVTQVFAVFGGGTLAVRGDGMLQAMFLSTAGGSGPAANSTKKIAPGEWFTVSIVATRDGFHEYTLASPSAGIEHVGFAAGSTRGIESLKIGTYTGAYYHRMRSGTVLGWNRELTRTERETLADRLPLAYPAV